MGIVDEFEPVQVEVEHRQGTLVTAGQGQGLPESVLAQDPVRQVGEIVVKGQVLDALLGRFLDGDIPTETEQGGAAVEQDLGRAHLHGNDLSLGGSVQGLEAGLSLLVQQGDPPRGLGGILGGIDVGDAPLEEVFPAIAVLPAGLVVHVDHPPFQVQDKDGVNRIVEEGAVTFLALP